MSRRTYKGWHDLTLAQRWYVNKRLEIEGLLQVNAGECKYVFNDANELLEIVITKERTNIYFTENDALK